MFDKLLRCVLKPLTSQTFMSGVLAIAAQVACAKYGVPLPDAAVAAIPLAVGWKEGKRREAEAHVSVAESAAQDARNLRYADQMREDEKHARENDPVQRLAGLIELVAANMLTKTPATTGHADVTRAASGSSTQPAVSQAA